MSWFQAFAFKRVNVLCRYFVEADRLQLRSHVYKLNVYLPHRVDSDKGKAEWDQKTECLKITLPIVEDEDGYY
jgi:hypothetical protein